MRLIRSGELHKASKHDIELLVDGHNLARIVDFRTDMERKGAPDPQDEMPNITFHDLPVFTHAAIGITHEGGAAGDMAALKNYMGDPVAEVEKLYKVSLLENNGQKAYASFLEILLDASDGATLWHCTEGKDRAGLAAVLVESALGVPIEYVRADYLATNIFVRNAAEKLLDLLGRHGVASEIDLDIDAFMYANINYLDGALNAIKKEYGGMDIYLDKALGFGADKVSKLQELYLE